MVAHGAVINCKDRFGHTPIDDAKECGYDEIVKYLKQKLEEQNETDQEISSDDPDIGDEDEEDMQRGGFKSAMFITPHKSFD